MAKVKVVIQSSIMVPHIQIDMSLREAKLIIKDHENLTAILKSDIENAAQYIVGGGGPLTLIPMQRLKVKSIAYLIC